jgi:hypothetical protein
MSIDTNILLNLHRLSPEDKKKVAEFVESLVAAMPPRPRKSAMGMFAHLGIDIPPEVIDEARREAWANFPREFPEGAGT